MKKIFLFSLKPLRHKGGTNFWTFCRFCHFFKINQMKTSSRAHKKFAPKAQTSKKSSLRQDSPRSTQPITYRAGGDKETNLISLTICCKRKNNREDRRQKFSYFLWNPCGTRAEPTFGHFVVFVIFFKTNQMKVNSGAHKRFRSQGHRLRRSPHSDKSLILSRGVRQCKYKQYGRAWHRIEET